MHYFLLCFQLEKYQDVIKATEEFETKLMSLGMCFEISNYDFNFTGKNLKFMIGQDCYLFQFGHDWKKLTLTFIFLPLQS